MERIRDSISKLKNKVLNKLKSNDGASSGIETIFIFYFGIIIVAFIFQVFSCIAITSSARDTLDRATLSATSTAMTTPDMYIYLRENTDFSVSESIHTLETVCQGKLDEALNETLTEDLGLIPLSNSNSKYEKSGYYTLDIRNKSFEVENETGIFTVEATLNIPINLFNGSYTFETTLTSKARYANKNEDS